MKYANMFKITTAAAMLVMAGNSVAAGPTATLQVKGSITPAACTPTLSNGGIIDVGATSTSEFGSTKFSLPSKLVQLTVSCTAPTKLSFSATDNRSTSFVAGIGGYGNGADFGLGTTTDEKKIGGYTIYPKTATIDGNAADILSSDNLSSWNKFVGVMGSKGTSGAEDVNISVGATSTGVPAAFTDMTMDLSVETFLSNEMKSITELQNIDGNATLNFEYR